MATPTTLLQPPGSGPTPLWLDCDPGHDDAFALLLATSNPSLNLLGVSTVHGNASLDNTTTNALKILTALGRPDIPVHRGAAKPFCRSAVHAPEYHGDSGLDGTDLLPQAQARVIVKPNAVLAMRHAIMDQQADSVFLVATGALTNVALLFATFPETVSHVKGLSIMGGGIGHGFTDAHGFRAGGGNWTEWAEFNIYCDPEAAESIFSNTELARKTTLIPLDLTHQALASGHVRETVLGPYGRNKHLPPGPASNVRPMFLDLLAYFASTYLDVAGLAAGPALHDPLAVAVLLSEEELRFDDRGGERWQVKVFTDGIHSKSEEEHGYLGQTIITPLASHERGVRIPRSLDVSHLWELIDKALIATEARLAEQSEADAS